MQNFLDLKVWHKAHAVTLATYQITESFPATERYGLTSQMRRAAASVPSNIAEGCVRSSDADFARFLYMALGSANELDYFALLARDLKMLPAPRYEQLVADVQEVKRMLSALVTRLKAES